MPARVVFERWLTEKYPGTALDRDEWNDWQYKAFDVRVAWDAWRAGRAHLIDTQEPAAWVFEWGAVALPHGHPSRITCMSAHPTKAEALALAESPDYNEFNYLVYPAYCVDESGPPND